MPFRFVGSALLLAAALSCCSSEPDVGGSKLFGAGSTDGSTARPPPADVRSFVDSESSTPTGSQPGDGCTKVDFLFVIDRSGSMTDFQNRLHTACPGFINASLEQVPGTGHHIMVVDSDGCENTALLDCAPDDAMADCPGYPVDECTAADYSGCGDLLEQRVRQVKPGSRRSHGARHASEDRLVTIAIFRGPCAAAFDVGG